MLQTSTSSEHVPALDGLRGLAVSAVVVYHLEASWLPGGYLGVSLFMTLSGYLITRLVVTEFERDGSVGLRRFWARRARRLLPAAMCVIAVVSLVHVTSRGEVLSAVGYVSNWWQLVHHQSYGAMFAAPSPLEHLWSLAVEEQYYLVLPLIAVVALRWGGRRGLAIALGAVAVGSVALGASLGEQVAYLNTGARLVEFAIGGLLALSGVPRVRTWVGVTGLTVLGLLWATVPQAEPHLFRGVLVAHAVVASVVIAWAVRGRPGLLTLPPLRALGRASYAIYLVHWPVFVLLHAGAPERLTVTAALAALLHLTVENPIRFRMTPSAAVSVAAVAAVVGVLGASIDPAAGVPVASVPATPAPAVSPYRTTSTSSTSPRRPARVLVIGDSTATYLDNGGALQTDDHLGLIGQGDAAGIIVDGASLPGCAYLDGWRSKLTSRDAVWLPPPEPTTPCGRWQADLSATVRALRPDLVLFFAGPMLAREWASPDRRCVGTARSSCVAAWMHAGFDRIAQAVAPAPIVWATAPPAAWRSSQGGGEFMDDPQVVGAVNGLIALRPHIDYASWFDSQPDASSLRLPSPDQTHLSPSGAPRAAAWVLGQLEGLLAQDAAATSAPAVNLPARSNVGRMTT